MTMTMAMMEAFAGERVPKFMATVDADGQPNVVPIISMTPLDERTIAFAEYLMVKTKRNLDANGKVAGIAITEDLRYFSFQGTFLGWENKGRLVDQFNKTSFFRYNSYTGVRKAGKIKVDKLLRVGGISKIRMVAEFLQIKAMNLVMKSPHDNRKMPLNVAEKFNRIAAIKVLAHVTDQSLLDVHPALSMQSADLGTLKLGMKASDGALRDIPSGSMVAASVITMDPIAYQVKGKLYKASSVLSSMVRGIMIEQVYSASPPLVGERIDSDVRSVPYRESGWNELTTA